MAFAISEVRSNLIVFLTRYTVGVCCLPDDQVVRFWTYSIHNIKRFFHFFITLFVYLNPLDAELIRLAPSIDRRCAI